MISPPAPLDRFQPRSPVNQSVNTDTESDQLKEEELVLKMPVDAADVSFSLVTIVSVVAQLAIVFGGVVPYIPQYLQISRSGDADGFSLYVCLALLTANILRIIFWFGKGFETPLLIQSILMSIAMLVMIHLVVQTKARSLIVKKTDRTLRDSSSDTSGEGIPQRHFTDFEMNHFLGLDGFCKLCSMCWSIHVCLWPPYVHLF